MADRRSKIARDTRETQIELELERCLPDRICDCAPDPRGVECPLPPMGAGNWIVRSAAGELTLEVVPMWAELPAPDARCVEP